MIRAQRPLHTLVVRVYVCVYVYILFSVRARYTDAAKMAIQAFLSLRLDYCNSLLTASPTAWYDDYKRFRTLPHVSLLVRGGAIISAQSSGSCIDHQFTSV